MLLNSNKYDKLSLVVINFKVERRFCMKFFGFRGGVHPPENKIQTENMAVEELKAPKMLYIALLQH